MKAPSFWQSNNPISLLLTPLSWLYRFASFIDRTYKLRQAKTLPIPTIVIGNINIGGTGKTPTTIALIEALHAKGLKVGVISRGYGRKNNNLIIANQQSTIDDLGDEPLLIYQKTLAPMAVHSDRYEAGKALIEKHSYLDVILADDGLQHHKLNRHIEIAVVGEQGLGNGQIFPAGPLRETKNRLQSVDFIISNGADESLIRSITNQPIIKLQTQLGTPYALHSLEEKLLSDFSDQSVSAIAGIAYPRNFFQMLEKKGIKPIGYEFPDHYHYDLSTFQSISTPILMTEKDAVKCRNLELNNCWVIPLESTLDDQFITKLIKMLK